MFFDVLSTAGSIKSRYPSNVKARTFLSKKYLKNRAGLGFLFLAGRNFLGSQFSNLFLGTSRVRLHRKINVLGYLDFIFDDFYSNFNLILTDTSPRYFVDLHFFASNSHLNKIMTYNY